MMCDAQCKKCGNRFGWAGSVLDAPTCPKCGTRIPAVDLEHDQKEIDDFRQFLAEKPAKTGSANYWNRARYLAGLTHGQAARILGIAIGDLFSISEGRSDPLPWLAERMREVYGLELTVSTEPVSLSKDRIDEIVRFATGKGAQGS